MVKSAPTSTTSTAPNSSETSGQNGLNVSQLAEIKLKPLFLAGEEVSQENVAEIDAGSLWAKHPVFFLIVRRTGCITCRELVSEVTQFSQVIKDEYGIKLVAIVKENIAADVSGFREYFSGDIYIDTQLGFYRALTGGKLVTHSALMTLFRPAVWSGIQRASKKGIKNGSLGGEATINGGFLLVSGTGVHYQFNENVGVLPSADEILSAMKNVSGKVDGPVVEASTAKRAVCKEDVCTLQVR